MFYCVFIFLWCLFMFSGAIVKAEDRVFYISGYNTSNAKEVNQTTKIYQYDKDQVLNISCHIKIQHPVIFLNWLHNGRIIGTENKSNENILLFNITKSNHNDTLICRAAEDSTGLGNGDKRIDKKLILLLKYIGHEDMPSDKDNSDHWIEKLLKSTLFWIAVVVAIVVTILAAILVFAGRRSYRIKEDTTGLHPAVSKASVFTTDSRTPIMSQHSITEDKVGSHPAVSNSSYFTTNSRTPTIPRHEITEVNYYTNGTYNNNKRHLNASREIINSEYQEPIDSQTYCEPQVYCEPEKQFYAEPIPKNLRKKNDTAYVNYNKSNDSANINNKNIDLYQNWENVRDKEFYYYTDTC